MANEEFWQRRAEDLQAIRDAYEEAGGAPAAEPFLFPELTIEERRALARLCAEELERLGCKADPAVTSALFKLVVRRGKAPQP